MADDSMSGSTTWGAPCPHGIAPPVICPQCEPDAYAASLLRDEARTAEIAAEIGMPKTTADRDDPLWSAIYTAIPAYLVDGRPLLYSRRARAADAAWLILQASPQDVADER